MARVAELVDARDLKSLGRKAVRVRFSSRAPETKQGLQRVNVAGPVLKRELTTILSLTGFPLKSILLATHMIVTAHP